MKLYCGIDNGTSGAIGIVSEDSSQEELSSGLYGRRLKDLGDAEKVNKNRTI